DQLRSPWPRSTRTAEDALVPPRSESVSAAAGGDRPSRGNDVRPTAFEAIACGGRTLLPPECQSASHCLRCLAGSRGNDVQPTAFEAIACGGRTLLHRE